MIKLHNGVVLNTTTYSEKIKQVNSLIEEFGGVVTSQGVIPFNLVDYKCFVSEVATLSKNTAFLERLKEIKVTLKEEKSYTSIDSRSVILSFTFNGR